MRVKISVTQCDLSRGKAVQAGQCPVARAVNRVLLRAYQCFANYHAVCIYTRLKYKTQSNTRPARRYIGSTTLSFTVSNNMKRIDVYDKTVKPFSFHLHLSPEYVKRSLRK